MAVHHRGHRDIHTHSHSHSHTYRQYRAPTWPHMHILSLWDEVKKKKTFINVTVGKFESEVISLHEKSCNEITSFDYSHYELLTMLYLLSLDLFWCMDGYCGFAGAMCGCVGAREPCACCIWLCLFQCHCYCVQPFITSILILPQPNVESRPTCVIDCDVTNATWSPGFLS